MATKTYVIDSFHRKYIVNSNTSCWEWIASLDNSGYGRVSGLLEIDGHFIHLKTALAHRVSWMIKNGAIPQGAGFHGTVVMHKCDNPACVNPEHLMIGTQSDNVKDMINKCRKVSGTPSGVYHWMSKFKDQADIDLICSTKGKTKELAEKYGVDVCTIKRIRTRNGIIKPDAEKFKNKPISQEAIDHIRSTPKGTRGLGKLYGLGKTTIANIRKGLTHK